MLIHPYHGDPHTTVSATCSFKDTSNSDWDLESVLQFVSGGQAAAFDFSIFALVGGDHGESIAEVRQQITEQVDAFTALKDVVVAAWGDYLAKAGRAQMALRNLENEALESA